MLVSRYHNLVLKSSNADSISWGSNSNAKAFRLDLLCRRKYTTSPESKIARLSSSRRWSHWKRYLLFWSQRKPRSRWCNILRGFGTWKAPFDRIVVSKDWIPFIHLLALTHITSWELFKVYITSTTSGWIHFDKFMLFGDIKVVFSWIKSKRQHQIPETMSTNSSSAHFTSLGLYKCGVANVL